MCENQVDIFGNPLNKMQSAEFLAHTLKTHKIKLYKKCSTAGCNIMITNKSWHHYCIDHMMDAAAATSTVIEFPHPFVSIPGVCPGN